MRRVIATLGLTALLAAGCASSAARAKGSPEVLRLGVFPNLTHAPGLIGIAQGILARELAPTRLEVVPFNSGSEAGNALLAGSIDATYIGPGPTVSLFIKSGRVAVVSGATEGGASLVVRKGAGILRPTDFAHKRVADPGIGNTQDVALRTWLHQHGLRARDEGGTVTVVALEKNSDSVQLMRSGRIDGAWLPEPYPSLLISEGLATRFLDERSLWPGGRFLTTNLLVSTDYLSAHPAVVRRLVEGNVRSILFIRDHPAQAARIANAELAKLGGKSLDPTVLQAAWTEMSFTWDPLPASLLANARRARDLGYIDALPSDLRLLYRLDDLNAVLSRLRLPPVEVGA